MRIVGILAYCRWAIALSFALLLASAATAQRIEAYAGGLYASGNSIVSGRSGNRGGDFVFPGLSAGIAYATRDSTAHFRLEAGWELQGWEQDYYTSTTSSGSAISTQSEKGIRRARLGIVRVVPMLAVPLSKRTWLHAGADLGVVVAATVTETHEITSSVTPPGPQGTFTTVTQSDTVYHGTAWMNPTQWALRLGMHRRFGQRWSVGATGAVGRPVFSFTRPTNAGWPVSLRLLVCYRIFSWHKAPIAP